VKRSFLSLFAALAVAISAGVASASVEFDLGVTLQGQTTPAGSAPWAVVRIYDHVNDGVVGLTNNDALIVVTANLNAGLHVAEVGLNFTGDPLGLTFAYLGGGASTPAFQSDNGPYTVDGSNGYEFLVDFQGPDLLTGSESAYIKVSRTGGLSYNDFIATSTNKALDTNDPYYAAARIDTLSGIGGFVGANTAPPASGPVPTVPEPASLAIWGLGLGIAGLVRLRRKS